MKVVLRGKGVSPGKVKGNVLVIKDPGRMTEARGSRVIAAPYTTPLLAPLLVQAKAIVLERGGVTTHGAVIAREFGIPCVVQAKGVLDIPDGVEVAVNGEEGTITYET